MAEIRRVLGQDAAAHFYGLEHLDPSQRCTAQDLAEMCHRGECFAVEAGPKARAIFVIERGPGGVFVTAAAGGGDADLTAEIDAALRQIAPGPVTFQTQRRGLVRRSQQLGYHVAGYIMRRDQ